MAGHSSLPPPPFPQAGRHLFMRGGQVMMRALGSAKRWPFLPLARIMAALPKA